MKQKLNTDSNSGTQLFGILDDGRKVHIHEISNSNGMSLQVMEYGATVVGLKKTLKNGKLVDLVLGFDTLQEYVDSFSLPSPPYMGATVGRYAGRIGNAELELSGKKSNLFPNNNGNSLHGGAEGFSQKIWKLEQLKTGSNPSIVLSYLSPDGEEGYLGELQTRLTYTLTEENELEIEYHAFSDAETVVNLTHHSYFNLEGQDGNVLDQQLYINASKILATKDMIPTGELVPVVATEFDFTSPKPCPVVIDTTFVLDTKETLVATLFSAKNNLKMGVYTNQPGLHVYVGGNCFNQIKGKENADYHSQSGICFETQNYPDAPNHAHFPSSKLVPGAVYFQKTVYKFQSF